MYKHVLVLLYVSAFSGHLQEGTEQNNIFTSTYFILIYLEVI